MQRYFIYLSYDGSAYHGWQIQPNGISVQEKLQEALSKLLRQKIEIVGAGRTDTGVHARMMVAHFDFSKSIEEEQLRYRLNRLLPRDITINKVIPVEADMHARFSAKWRTYRYYIHTQKDAFLRHYSYESPYKLEWVQTSAISWYFEITANRFLRNMVRATVGTLFLLGRHHISLDDLDYILQEGDRSNAGESMPGHALFLENIEY